MEQPMDHPSVYRVRVTGHPSPSWATWFEGASLAPEPNDETTLTIGPVDQAALHGLLARIRDMGLPLVSVLADPPDADQDPAPPVTPEHSS
jgi:hypothetical protein